MPASARRQKLKITIPTHSRSAEQILYDENRDFMIGGNNDRPAHSSFYVDEVISGLAVEGETIVLENLDQH